MNPIRGEFRREDRHRYEPAPKPANFGVESQHFAIGNDIRAADLDRTPRTVWDVKRLDQIVEDGADGDRLNASVHPAWANHHWHPLGEIADHFERQTSGAHDDPSAKLGNRQAAFPQGIARLLAGTKMG